MKKVWMDELIIEEVWKQFMQRLVSEWSILVGYVRFYYLQFPDVPFDVKKQFDSQL
jgi:hypothetical protein